MLYETGHIPGAVKVDWFTTLQNPLRRDFLSNEADSTFKSADELRQLYQGQGILLDKEIIAYCRIGERSSHTWFVLTFLLG